MEGPSGFTNGDKFLTGTPIIPRSISPSAVGPHICTKLLIFLFTLKYRGGGGPYQVNYWTTSFVHSGAQDPRNVHKSGCSQKICRLTAGRFVHLRDQCVPS